MTRQNLESHSMGGLSRRSLLQSTAALLSVPFVAKATTAWAQEKLAGSGEVVVFSYGGSLTEALRKSVYDPFTKATGINVVDVTGDLADARVQAMFRAGKVDWDISNVGIANYPAMQEAGMFVPIDYTLWDQESLEGVPQHARLKDAFVMFSSAEVLAYDQRAFPKGGPENWVDFWNVKKFPGPRGLYSTLGKYNIVHALDAAGFAPKDIWPLTDDKLDRAFEKLNEIKPHITKWWTAGGEAPQLLISREYAMSSASDGRLFSVIREGAPIKYIWEGAFLVDNYAMILKGGPNTANAQKLVAFLNRAKIAAEFTKSAGFPAPNTNQLKYLPADLIPLLSINPQNASKCIPQDAAWLGAKRPDGKTNQEHVEERWLAWRTQ